MEIPERRFGDVAVLSPLGRVDLANGEAFLAGLVSTLTRLSADAPPLVVLDLGRVDYISSIGLRALMVAAKQAKAAQGQIAVSQMTATVAEIFDIARFKFVLPAFADTREALASMSADAARLWDEANRD